MITDYEPVYELDGDEVGSLMGWLLYGDVTPDDLDEFLNENDEVRDEAEWRLGSDFDAIECWVRKVPIRSTGGSRYVYAYASGPGARKCLRVEPTWPTARWCVNHPFEPYRSAVPVQQVKDPEWPKVLDGYVPLCAPCSRSFHERMEVARRAPREERRAS